MMTDPSWRSMRVDEIKLFDRNNPLVRKLSNVVELNNEDETALRNLCRMVREVGPNRDIISDGDRPDYVILILEGWACRYKILKDGSRQITAFMMPGDFCDMNVMVLRQMDHSIAALTDVKLAFVSRDQFADLVYKRSNILRALWWTTLVDEGILRAWLVNIGRRPSLQRVANLISELRRRAENIGVADAGGFTMPITQAEMADALGLTAVHINRVIARLATLGLVKIRRGNVTITDIAMLERVADFDPSYLHAEPLRAPAQGETSRFE